MIRVLHAAEMIRVLHAARVESENGKILGLELLLNRIGGIFKPDEEAPEDDDTLQAALSAQVRRTNYENCGAAAHDGNHQVMGIRRAKNQDLQNHNLQTYRN